MYPVVAQVVGVPERGLHTRRDLFEGDPGVRPVAQFPVGVPKLAVGALEHVQAARPAASPIISASTCSGPKSSEHSGQSHGWSGSGATTRSDLAGCLPREARRARPTSSVRRTQPRSRSQALPIPGRIGSSVAVGPLVTRFAQATEGNARIAEKAGSLRVRSRDRRAAAFRCRCGGDHRGYPGRLVRCRANGSGSRSGGTWQAIRRFGCRSARMLSAGEHCRAARCWQWCTTSRPRRGWSTS